MLYVIDLLILAILAFFAWRGAKKGLILTLCSLAGLLIAFFGARVVSTAFYQPVSHILQPGIYHAVLGAEPGQDEQPGYGAQEEAPVPGYTLDQLLDSIRQTGLFAGLTGFLDQAQEQDAIQNAQSLTPAQALSGYLARLAARAGLFALSFLAILLIWFLVGHMLDLAFHLPLLSVVNLAGGAALGLLKAAVLVLVLVWLGQLAGWIPQQPDTPVLSLFTPQGLGRLLNQLLV